jgi:hypothetical protein
VKKFKFSDHESALMMGASATASCSRPHSPIIDNVFLFFIESKIKIKNCLPAPAQTINPHRGLKHLKQSVRKFSSTSLLKTKLGPCRQAAAARKLQRPPLGNWNTQAVVVSGATDM